MTRGPGEVTVFTLSYSIVVWLIFEMSSWLSLCPAMGNTVRLRSSCPSFQRAESWLHTLTRFPPPWREMLPSFLLYNWGKEAQGADPSPTEGK